MPGTFPRTVPAVGDRSSDPVYIRRSPYTQKPRTLLAFIWQRALYARID